MGEILDKTYNPKDFENKWFDYWTEKNYFHSTVDKTKIPYTIVIPPPNVTSVLHMGHGLNNTIQDILIRWKRMQGLNALWIPGTDHAGIATQNVVERQLAKEGKSRHDLGREAFIERVWEWKHKHSHAIIDQLKKIGSSCDFKRERFTMDEGLSKAVREVFVKLYEDGLIYKGKYIINWCPRCTTALADDEVDYEELDGAFYHIKYPFAEGDGYIEIATTRPETMLGDTAVAVNPKDETKTHLIGKFVILPLVDKKIPVIADEYVDMEFGTGVVKITPAHDPNDFQVGLRHNLERVKIFNDDGTISKNAPAKYIGMDRFECRKALVKDLKDRDLFIKSEPHKHSVGHCYRCKSVVEPYLSEQWFVKMKPLAEKAIKVVEDGTIEMYPKKWKKTYLHWMYNVRDWCISRQIWWGHRIPVWYCKDCGEVLVSREDITKCSKCGSQNIEQDKDVLDTWFSSWLWPFSTMGWPEKTEDLAYFYPTNVLSTAPEILFFWVARMIMAGLYFMDKIPFSQVYLHATVLDEVGRKMSKSLGNGIDPLEVVKEYGADSLRFSVISLAPIGQNVLLSMDKFKIGSKFANKIWNASRYILMNFDPKFLKNISEVELDLPEKWIISRLNKTIKTVNEGLEKFYFNEVALTIYDFLWHDFCDWFVELSKIKIYSDNLKDKETAFTTLIYVLENSLRLLHPLMPFITEEIWQKLEGTQESITIAEYPSYDASKVDEETEKQMQYIMDISYSIRNIRGEMNIPPHKEIPVIIKSQEQKDFLNEYKHYFQSLCKVGNIKIYKNPKKPEKSAFAVGTGYEVFVPLADLIDLDKEKSRLEKELAKLEAEIEKTKKKLANKNFLEKAKPEVVEKERNKFEEYNNSIIKLKSNIEMLS